MRVRTWLALGLGVLTVAAVVAGIALVAARPTAAPPPVTTAPPTTTTPPTSTPPPLPPVGPPVLVVKIDNVAQARPPVGIGAADMIYVEPVEGGLSRIAAVFAAHLPPVVGPVRSARETDLGLVPQFGHPTLAFSGAAPALLPEIDAAPLTDAAADKVPGAYFRDNARVIPHNLFVRPDRLPAGAGWSPLAPLVFGAAASGGTPVSHQEVHYAAASIGFDWSAEDGRWLVSMDGAPYSAADSGRLAAGTVIIQSVPVHPSAFTDSAGNYSPLVTTVGTGHAVILRDGQAFEATWSRPTPNVGTTYTTPSGAPITFAAGQVWTVLTPQ